MIDHKVQRTLSMNNENFCLTNGISVVLNIMTYQGKVSSGLSSV